MTAVSLCVECTLHNDPRLFSGIGAVVTHAVRLAGLPEQDQDRISAALADACEKALRAVCGRDVAAEIKVSAADYPDRVEMRVEPLTRGAADVDLPREVARGNPAVNSPNGFEPVVDEAVGDRVKCEARDGYVRLTLTKCKGVAKAGANS
jgi:hypothetical protein